LPVTISPRIASLGGCDEVLYRRRAGASAVRNAKHDCRRGRYEWTNLQSWAGQATEALRHESHAAARFDSGDHASGTVVFFGDVEREFQRREQASEPFPILWIIAPHCMTSQMLSSAQSNSLSRL
jgi:hypothetical protein